MSFKDDFFTRMQEIKEKTERDEELSREELSLLLLSALLEEESI